MRNMTTRTLDTRMGTVGRRERFKDNRHDVYLEALKPEEPSLCSECGAVYTRGRWSWASTAPVDAHLVLCPACRRIADKLPAGYIQIRGFFFDNHREEMLHLIRNVESAEATEHPLERIMSIVDDNSHTLILTTGVHIAQRIGKALSRSYDGHLSIQYGDDEHIVTVIWER